MEGGRAVAPADLDRRPRSAPEVARARVRPGKRDETPVPARPRAVCDPFDHRLGGAARNVDAGGEIDRQMGRVREPALQMRGEAIARNHVEADARQERHSGSLRLGVPRGERLEHVDLAGDVEIVRAFPQARVGYCARRGGERAGGAEDDSDVFQRGVDLGAIGEAERPPRQVKLPRDRFQFFGVSARKHGAMSLPV